MNTDYHFAALSGYPRPHGDIAYIGQALDHEDAMSAAKYHARRVDLPLELIRIRADSSDEAIKKFNDGEGETLCRITSETTYKIEILTEEVQ